MSRSFLPLISMASLLVACTGAVAPSSGDATCSTGGGPASLGSITFEVVASTGYACDGDGHGWLQISAASGGTSTPIANNEPYTPVDCCTCTGVTFPLGTYCMPVSTTGVTTPWDGTYWQPGTCGPSATACYFHVAAPAGSYVANMCTSTVELAPIGCTSVPFDYPGSSPVVGTVM